MMLNRSSAWAVMLVGIAASAWASEDPDDSPIESIQGVWELSGHRQAAHCQHAATSFYGTWSPGWVFEDIYRGIRVELIGEADEESMDLRVSRSAAKFDRHVALSLEHTVIDPGSIYIGEASVSPTAGDEPLNISNIRIQSNITEGHSVELEHACPETLAANNSCTFTVRTQRDATLVSRSSVFLLRMDTNDSLMPQPVVEFRHSLEFYSKSLQGEPEIIVE